MRCLRRTNRSGSLTTGRHKVSRKKLELNQSYRRRRAKIGDYLITSRTKRPCSIARDLQDNICALMRHPVVGISAPTIWECTRFCLDERLLNREQEEVQFASTLLIIALGNLASKAGIEFDHRQFQCCRASSLSIESDAKLRCSVQPCAFWRAGLLGLHPISGVVVRRIKKLASGALSLRRSVGHGRLTRSHDFYGDGSPSDL